VQKTWSPVGQTPVVPPRYRHDRLSAISGIAVSPRRFHCTLYCHLYEDNIQGEEVAVFLRHLLRQIHGPIIALLVMTRAKSGSVSVVNARGKLVGVFTDGDLRRKMSQDEQALSRPLKGVMTRNPVTVRDEALAVEALKIFDERNIDDLIVVNAKREPVGLVDSQDLPKLKIM